VCAAARHLRGDLLMDELLKGLATNGPWAMVAGFLLWKVIDAWTADRKQVTTLMGEFRGTLEALKTSVDHLARQFDDGRHMRKE